MEWIDIKKELPKISDEQSFVTVMVKTEHELIGECGFGYSGAMGESMEGSFWMPIRKAKGEVHYDNKITHWKQSNFEKAKEECLHTNYQHYGTLIKCKDCGTTI